MDPDTLSDHESDLEVSEWEIEDNLPQFTDHFIQKYLEGREALIEQEKAQRSDYAFRQSLTPMAAEACAIVARILADEHRTVWTNEYEHELAKQTGVKYFPGMMFHLARERMERTKTWEIVRKMPKGALLHCHMDAMIDADWLISQALATDGIAMKADMALDSPETREKASVQFQYVQNPATDMPSIWTESYKGNTFIPISAAANSFPDGGLDRFKAWLMSRMTISTDESLGHHQGVDSIWEKFTSCFPIIGSILFYEPILRPALQRLFLELVDDGVRWADLRCAFVFQFRLRGSETPAEGYADFFRVFDDELSKFQSTKEGKSFWGSRFIWTTLRSFGKKNIVQSMKECVSVKKVYPHLISGFDVVGQEDLGRPLADLTPELFWFRKRCMEEAVDVPFFFHAGECLGDGDKTDQNLFDAVLLGTRRIGHAFSLYKHPLLVELVKEKKILVESCPISNEVLRLTSSIKSHSLPALLARGVPASLSTDDPAILGQGKNGMTHDFWQALQGWENLGLEGLGSLAENSVRYAAYAPDQNTKEWNKDIKDGVYGQGVRAERLREWTHQWNEFCEWIVIEYAADYGSDEG